MEPETDTNPIEQLDRDEKRAIAAAVRARFVTGDIRAAMRQVDEVARRRLEMNAQVTRLYA